MHDLIFHPKLKNTKTLREDTHNKKCFFSGQKLGKKRKNCQNPFQAIIRLKKRRKKKWKGPLSH